MKINELPLAYRGRARKRWMEEALRRIHQEDDLTVAFAWEETPEGVDFWKACRDAESPEELPLLPARNFDGEVE